MCVDRKFMLFGLAGIFAINAVIHAAFWLLGWSIIVPEAGIMIKSSANLYLFISYVILSYLLFRMYSEKPKAKAKRKR